jgi:signal peptidase
MNYNFYVVVSDSMVPNLNTGDIVIIGNDNNTNSSFTQLNLGDVIVFEAPSSPGDLEKDKKIVVHRVEQLDLNSEGQRVIRTKGDTNPVSIEGVDYPITQNKYVGKVVNTIPYLGLFLMYLNLLIQITIQPIFYLAIGAIIVTIFILEYQKKNGLE